MQKSQVTAKRAGSKAKQAEGSGLVKPSELAALGVNGLPVLVGDNHIVQGSVFVIAGERGVGKSHAAAALAVAGARVETWFGLPVRRHFKTLIVQCEAGQDRLASWFAPGRRATVDHSVRVSLPFTFNVAQLVRQVRQWVREFSPDVVVLDSWNSCQSGEKCGPVLDTLERIREAVAVGDKSPALGIVVHTRTPRPEEKADIRALKRVFDGSSYVLTSVPRSVFVLYSAGDSGDGRVVAACVKNTDGATGTLPVGKK